jgi:hypothetical protein
MTIKNELGKRYGCLTVMRADVRPPGPDGRNRAYWICRCMCGEEKSILGDHLRSGAIRTCANCDSEKKLKNIHKLRGQAPKWEVGNRYGTLTVIELQRRQYGGSADRGVCARWICLCDCGTETVVIGTDLRKGHTGSCGCLGLWSGRGSDGRFTNYRRASAETLETQP